MNKNAIINVVQMLYRTKNERKLKLKEANEIKAQLGKIGIVVPKPNYSIYDRKSKLAKPKTLNL